MDNPFESPKAIRQSPQFAPLSVPFVAAWALLITLSALHLGFYLTWQSVPQAVLFGLSLLVVLLMAIPGNCRKVGTITLSPVLLVLCFGWSVTEAAYPENVSLILFGIGYLVVLVTLIYAQQPKGETNG